MQQLSSSVQTGAEGPLPHDGSDAKTAESRSIEAKKRMIVLAANLADTGANPVLQARQRY